MEKEERRNKMNKVQKLGEALGLIYRARDLVDEAIEGTDMEDHYYSYGRYGLDTAIGEGNPYDGSIPKIMNSLKGLPEDYDEY
jgi:hypothetical protein